MMAKTIACLFLAIAIVSAVPDNDVVPEDNMYENDSWSMDPSSVHEEAASDVAGLLQAGKTTDACAQLADSTMKQVTDSIASAQSLVNAVPKGAACKQEGKASVDVAKKTLDGAKSKATAANKASATAKTKPVKFKDVTIAEIKAGDCSAFFSDPSFTSAKKAAQTAADAAAKADGELKAAQKAYDDAVTAQKAAIHACACHTKEKHNEAKKAADKANSAENAKAWTKSHHMKCVLAGTTANSCKVPAIPKVTMPSLQEPAKSATNCGGVHYSGKEITLFFKTGSSKNSQSGNKATVTLHGSTGKSWSTKVSAPGNGKSASTKHKVDVNLGSVTSVSLKAGGTDGWLLMEAKVDGTDFSHGLPAWVDGKPYDKASGYNPYRHGDNLTVKKGKACLFEKGKDFRGPHGKEDIKKVRASNAGECSNKCAAYSGCQYFAFVDNGDCYLKHNYNHKLSNSRVTSGFACKY